MDKTIRGKGDEREKMARGNEKSGEGWEIREDELT
jgi:hypothetical protein